MVEHKTQRLDTVFQALSDPTRRRMLHSLRSRPRSVGELAAPFQISLAAASKHIKVLERAGLVEREVQGRTHLCQLRAQAMAEAARWLDHYRQFWELRLDALQAALEAEDAAASEPVRKSARKGKKA
jgi:DNA-binding transcriptional ArsR family regulator